MKALILAGGKGTRLRPYTTVIPKPLMPVGDFPILEIILRQLKRAGVTEVILAVGYMSQLFQAFFEDGKRLGLGISYSLEEKPLGTAGPIALVLDQLQGDFMIMNGDLLTTLDYGALFKYHQAQRAAATIATYTREVKVDFGVVETNDQHELAAYREKPLYTFDVSMGVNVLNAEILREVLVPGQYLDIPDLMLKLKGLGKRVSCYRESCYWLDIGRVDDYQIASDIFEARRAEFLPE
jgi:NDP-sugar pyrophosphorylase family protein